MVREYGLFFPCLEEIREVPLYVFGKGFKRDSCLQFCISNNFIEILEITISSGKKMISINDKR